MAEAGSFFDGACLFSKTNGISSLLKHEPKDFNFWDLMPLITVNAFAPGVHTRLIYAFTAPNHICYCYNFKYEKVMHSIVVITSQPFPYLYLSFFSDTTITFENVKNKISPECRFSILCPLLRAWQYETSEKMLVHYTNGSYHLDVDQKLLTYSHFNPFTTIDSKFNPLITWKTLLLERGKIRVYGSTPDQVSLACFGVASFCHPFKFRGKFLLAVSEYDPRIEANNFDEYTIIGIVSPNVSPDDRFVQTLHAGKIGPQEAMSNTTEMTLRVGEFHRNIEILMSYALSRDPYCNYLDMPIDGPEMEELIEAKDTQGSMSFSEMRAFFQTRTWKEWRYETRSGQETRESFLSNSPDDVLATKTPEQLTMCRHAVEELLERYSYDKHFIAVLKQHRKIIEKRLSENTE